jgi:hypothetical protein
MPPADHTDVEQSSITSTGGGSPGGSKGGTGDNTADNVAIAGELALLSSAAGIMPSAELLTAYAAAAAPNSLRAFRSDVNMFVLWCCGKGIKTLAAPIRRRCLPEVPGSSPGVTIWPGQTQCAGF